MQHSVALRKRKVRSRCVEQRPGRRVVEAGEPVFRQPRIGERRRVAVTRSGQEDNRVGLDATRNERQYICCRGVDPVRVLDDQQHGGVAGDVRNEVERGHGNPEVLRRHLARQSESSVERVALDRRQVDRTRAYRTQQLMQPGERQMRF